MGPEKMEPCNLRKPDMRHSNPKLSFQLLAVVGAFAVAACSSTPTAESPAAGDSKPELIVRNLMATELAGVDDTEVVISHVTIPPNTSLQKHWHPGEEFAYVLEGSATLWQQGKRNVTTKA